MTTTTAAVLVFQSKRLSNAKKCSEGLAFIDEEENDVTKQRIQEIYVATLLPVAYLCVFLVVSYSITTNAKCNE